MLRTRQRITTEPTFMVAHSTMPVEPFTTDSRTPMGYAGIVEVISDQNNGKNRDILSPVTLTRWKRTLFPGSVTCQGTNGWATYISGDVSAYFAIGADVEEELPRVLTLSPTSSSILLMKALADIKQGAVMSGEILNDLGKTLSMLRRPLEGSRKLLGKILTAQRHHLGKTSGNVAQASAKAWLEHRYGWKPLILDLEKGIDGVMKIRGKIGVKSSVAKAGSKVTNSGSHFWPQPSPSWCGGSQTVSSRASCDVGIRYTVQPRTTQDQLSKLFSTRASDVPATVWECIPYSFVIDWFANVGDWVQAITPVPGLALLGWWVTSISESKLTTQKSISNSQPNAWNGNCGGDCIEQLTYTRVINPPLPVTPELRWSSKPPNVLHQADGLALTIGQLTKGLQGLRH